MKKSALLLLLSVAQVAAMAQTKDLGLSDLTVSYPRNPLYEGDTLKVQVAVTNYGETNFTGYVGAFAWGGSSNSIVLDWSKPFTPDSTTVISTYFVARFGQEGNVKAYLYADNNVANDTVAVEDYLSVVRANANDLLISSVSVSDNGDAVMYYAGHTVDVVAAIVNQGRDAQSGVAKLLLDGAEVSTYEYTALEPEATLSATFSIVAPVGNHSLEVVLPEDDKLDNNSGVAPFVVFTEGRLNESFEGLEYNSSTYSYNWPEGWDHGKWQINNYNAGHGSMVASSYNNGDKMVTPKVAIGENDSLSFMLKPSGSLDCIVYASVDYLNWVVVDSLHMEGSYDSPYENHVVYFNSETNAEMAGKKAYLAFAVNNTQWSSLYIDCIQAPAAVAVETDLAVLSVKAASYLEAGVESQVLVEVYNNGLVPAEGTVELVVGGEVIATLATGMLEVGATVELQAAYTPAEATPALECQAILSADDADLNNAASVTWMVYEPGGMNLPFEQYFVGYGYQIADLPNWTCQPGWSLWSLYGNNMFQGRDYCLAFSLSTAESSLAVSPLLNLEQETLTVSFYMHRDDNQWHLDKLDGIRVWINNRPDTIGGILLTDVHRSYTQEPVVEAADWYPFEFTLTEGNHPTKGFIVLEGYGADGSYGYMYLDALKVNGQNAKDLAVSAVSPYDGAVFAGHNSATSPISAVIKNMGSETITGATLSWSVDGVAQDEVAYDGTLAPEETAEVLVGEYAFATAAQHVVKVTVNNEQDKLATNNTAEVELNVLEGETLPYSCEFDSEEELAAWTIVDQDQNQQTWSLADGMMINYSYNAETGDGYAQNDWLIAPAIYIPANDAVLAYSVVEEADGKDSYDVMVSTSLRDLDCFEPIYSKTITASEDVELSLAAYEGQAIFIAFRHTSSADDTESISLAVDNVQVTGTPTGIASLATPEASVLTRDLLGRVVKEGEHGLFVVGGKKIIK